MRIRTRLWMVVGLAWWPVVVGQDVTDEIARMEALAGSAQPGSAAAAEAMLGLVELYRGSGQVFALVRTARDFAASQPGHEKHADVMVALVEALAAASMNDELVAASRQFIERHAGHGRAHVVQVRLGEVLDRTGDARGAADAYGAAVRQAGLAAYPREAERAVVLYRELNSREAHLDAARLCQAVASRLAEGDARAAAFAWEGFQAARRAGEWARANEIGELIQARQLAGDEARRAQLWEEMGDNLRQLGDPAGAAREMARAAGLRGRPELWREVARQQAAAEAEPAALAGTLGALDQLGAGHPFRFEILWLQAGRMHASGDVGGALRVLETLLGEVEAPGDVAATYVRWMAEAEQPLERAEQNLKAAIDKVGGHAGRLRSALAFDLYRDRMDKAGDARAVVRVMLRTSPPDDEGLYGAMNWLLETQKEDEAGFRRDVDAIAKTAGELAHQLGYRGLLGKWAQDKRGDNERQEQVAYARTAWEALTKDEKFVLFGDWKKEDGKGSESRRKLLERGDLSAAQRLAVLGAEAYHQRHRGGDKGAAGSLPFYEELVRRAPDNFEAARAWLEAARTAGDEAVQKRAAAGLLGKAAPYADPVSARIVLAMAEAPAPEDPEAVPAHDRDLARRALQWLEAAERTHGASMDGASEIGGRLWTLGLEGEALGWWRRHVEADLDHWEARACAGQWVERLAEDKKAGALDELVALAASDNHGAYVSWRADLDFRLRDLEGVIRRLDGVRVAQDQRPFRGWGMGESPMTGWFTVLREAPEVAPEVVVVEGEEGVAAPEAEPVWVVSVADKLAVLGAVERLREGRASAAAVLERIELAAAREGGQGLGVPTGLARLLAIRDAATATAAHLESWRRLWPYAQRLAAAGEQSEAAILGTALLRYQGGAVGDGERAEARRLVTEAYAQLGTRGFEGDPDSPLAPLLEITLHLQLGDQGRAAELYHEHQEMFDANRAELPLDILLFGARTHILAGSKEDLQRAEDILRGWLMRRSEDSKVADRDKADVQLQLAKVYQRALRLDAARSEFTTLINRYPEVPQVVEAEFGIAETYLEQKLYGEGAEVLDRLAQSLEGGVRLRAAFLQGVLASRLGDPEAARAIFRQVLSSLPSLELADRALFELAEVYGGEQRFLDQLELLRTVGRLGRESARWHVPGHALPVVVQDPDLAISRGGARIPVRLVSEPGGDEEILQLRASGAGTGLFVGEMPTALGAAVVGDGVLQVRGGDVVRAEYPEEFRAQFARSRGVGPEIRLASDASFVVASRDIPPPVEDGGEGEEVGMAGMVGMAEDDPNDLALRSDERPANQIKPGNLVYLQVVDHDMSVSGDADEVSVRVAASSGDSVTARLVETAGDSGVFVGQVRTGTLPAAASASDTAIDSSALMAIDQSRDTAWASEPDGLAPKWLSVDLKELVEVDSLVLSTPDSEVARPTKMQLWGSHDGRFFYRLASYPGVEPSAVPEGSGAGAMRRSVFGVDNVGGMSWGDIVGRAAGEAERANVESLDYDIRVADPAAEDAPKGGRGVLWQGGLVQRRAGAMRLVLTGTMVAAMVNEELVLAPTAGPAEVDVYLEAGVHRVVFFASVADPARQMALVERARENLNAEAVEAAPFLAADFAVAEALEAGLEEVEAAEPSFAFEEEGQWRFALPVRELRHLRMDFDGFEGNAVVVNHVEVTGPGGLILPTDADLLELARNEVLEIAPGDEIVATYIDALPAGGSPRNRALERTLAATYHNGRITPVHLTFARDGGGGMAETAYELLRIDPGDRISFEVEDYDLDQTAEQDSVVVEISRGPGEPVLVTAVETGASTGVFRGEFGTMALGAAGEQAVGDEAAGVPVLAVAPGDELSLRYLDEENTFPGHAAQREAVVRVRQEGERELRILASQTVMGEEGEAGLASYLTGYEGDGGPVPVTIDLPLLVEVIDPHAAKHAGSTVRVLVETDKLGSVEVDLVLSEAHARAGQLPEGVRHAALEAGRFVGQVSMQLGDASSPDRVPRTAGMGGLIGRVLTAGGTAAAGTVGEGGAGAVTTVGVLNVDGEVTVTARLRDGEAQVEATDEAAAAAVPEAGEVGIGEVAGGAGEAGVLGGGEEGNAEAAEAAGAIEAVESGAGVEELVALARLSTLGVLRITDSSYGEAAEELYIGQKIYLRLDDPDQDRGPERDEVAVVVRTESGEEESVMLVETLSHSGVFTGAFDLDYAAAPVAGNLDAGRPVIEVQFGDLLSAHYLDATPFGDEAQVVRSAEIGVAHGADGRALAFSKLFGDEALAIETQFHIAESHFELFKSHRALEREEDAREALESGRRILRELEEDYPDPSYAPRVAYLLGQFSQELEDWEEAIESYERIVREHDSHSLAPDAQYKLGQCYEQAERFDEAVEAYVTLAATYPDNPLIASVMIRITDYFYRTEEFANAAAVGERFLARFDDHPHAPQLAFRVGQCYYKDETYGLAGQSFDRFVKSYPDDQLASQALFWSGESYRMANNVAEAFRRYNRCRWDFPESDAAKYARGRLALPEMLTQFEREATSIENEN